MAEQEQNLNGLRNRQKFWDKIIPVVKTPLAFYTLALLATESLMIGAVVLGSQQIKLWAILIGIGVFILIVAIVTILLLLAPEKLWLCDKTIRNEKAKKGEL